MARAVYWCEDDWMKVENLPHSACYGNHAVVLARYVVSRVFPKDVKLLSSLDLAQNLDQLPNDSEIVDYLHLFNSESQVNVTLEQGNNTFNVKWLLSATQGISTYFGIEPEPVETILARVLVVALASRGILQRNPAATFPVSNSDQRDVWWCVEDRVTVNDVTNSHCFGKHTVLKVKSALRRQFQRDIDALKDFQPPQDLPDDKVIDGLHLLQCESVNCKITLHHKDGTFSAEWDSPINKVVKCGSAFSKIVLAETVLARILVEVLTSQGHLQEQDMVESLSIPLGHSNAGSPMSHQPPESPSSATTLLNATSSDSASDGVHEPLHPVQFGADEKERTDDPIVKEESMGVHEPLHPVQFGADEEERTDDPIVKEESMDQEPMDTAAPQNSVEGAINIHAASAPFKFPSRAQLRKISMHGPKEKKQEVLCMLRSKEAISNLKRFTGLHCNVDEEWSRQFLECAVKCNKLHEVEVVWPSREHWELIHELRFLRRLEIYVIGELYKNPHTVELPIDHAQLIEAIQAEGLHPVSLASLLEAHRKSLKRLEVLVDLPGVSTRPKDSGRPLSDAELRELLERALGTLSQSSQELNVSTKLVRVAPAEALPASMFPERGRHVGCGCSAPVWGRQKKELYCEDAVPVEEDCRRYPKLQVVMLTRPVEGLHNRKSCRLQIQALCREWPSKKIFCGKCSKKEGKPKARLRKRKIDGSRKGCEFRI